MKYTFIAIKKVTINGRLYHAGQRFEMSEEEFNAMGGGVHGVRLIGARREEGEDSVGIPPDRKEKKQQTSAGSKREAGINEDTVDAKVKMLRDVLEKVEDKKREVDEDKEDKEGKEDKEDKEEKKVVRKRRYRKHKKAKKDED